MTADVETIVVGAGAVGLATARALAIAGHEVMVLEQHALIGSETSSRNSEVIHAGLYYPPGSLRARLCVRGKELLYRFCAENDVGHARCGKLLVATHESQLPKLAAIRETAARNGVTDLVPVDAVEARALEPGLACVAALISP
ncbi:MAG TPA: FAD-dependent oxidoreductase, partial [Hyphomicrobiaceae bacterium]|nr:FAD-dependent oxidoreductase [Hyphomicrobiaceae bacterium]